MHVFESWIRNKPRFPRAVFCEYPIQRESEPPWKCYGLDLRCQIHVEPNAVLLNCSCYPNTNKQRRALELIAGGGRVEGGLSALQLRALKSGTCCAYSALVSNSQISIQQLREGSIKTNQLCPFCSQSLNLHLEDINRTWAQQRAMNCLWTNSEDCCWMYVGVPRLRQALWITEKQSSLWRPLASIYRGKIVVPFKASGLVYAH